VRGIGEYLTAGDCIVGSCMVSGADWMLLGLNGKGDIGGRERLENS